MLVAVCGASGVGKTTIAQALREKGYSVVGDSGARDLAREWGITLSDLRNGPEDLVMSYQSTLLKKREELTLDYLLSSGLHFIERSPIEYVAFSYLWHKGTERYSRWLRSYQEKCQKSCNQYGGLIYLKPLDSIKDDGGRVLSADQKVLEVLVLDMVLQGSVRGVPLVQVDAMSVDNRMTVIDQFLSNI